jgi:protein-disulfide isomerase
MSAGVSAPHEWGYPALGGLAAKNGEDNPVTMLEVPVTADDHYQGPLGAPLTLVEYGDFECPHCGRAFGIILHLERAFSSDLCFVYRHFPLTSMHPHALLAAEASEAAGAQRMFWRMHDWLFENQDDLSPSRLTAAARKLSLDYQRFVQDLKKGRYERKVKDEFMTGLRSGVNGTPTFFINGEKHAGGYDLKTMMRALNRRLGQAA